MAETFSPVLARHLAEGCALSYVTDRVTGGVWAELREPDGLLVETGLGGTEPEAVAHLSERLERA